MEVQSNDMTVASRALWEHAASSKKKKKVICWDLVLKSLCIFSLCSVHITFFFFSIGVQNIAYGISVVIDKFLTPLARNYWCVVQQRFSKEMCNFHINSMEVCASLPKVWIKPFHFAIKAMSSSHAAIYCMPSENGFKVLVFSTKLVIYQHIMSVNYFWKWEYRLIVDNLF